MIASSVLRRGLARLSLEWFAHWRRDREAELRLLPALCRPGCAAVDVGAHKGLYAVHLSRLCPVVYAFEPVPHLAERLRRGLPARVRVETVALSSAAGTRELRWPRGNRAWSTVEPANRLELAGARIESQIIEARPLDAYGLAGVGFIKIDVEGHELAVLRGAARLLRDDRPRLLVEVEERHHPGALDQLRELLAALDYAGLFLDGARLRPLAEFSVARDQPIAHVTAAGKAGRYLNNFIFVARDELPAFAAAAARLGITAAA